MTSADFSQFVVTARLLSLKPRLRDLPSYGRTLSGLYPLGLLSAVRIVIGLLLLVQHCPCLSALYQVLVHRANRLPPTSFRFRLTADTLVFGCNLPTIRAVWGLAPVRVRSCWANKKEGQLIYISCPSFNFRISCPNYSAAGVAVESAQQAQVESAQAPSAQAEQVSAATSSTTSVATSSSAAGWLLPQLATAKQRAAAQAKNNTFFIFLLF